MINRTKIDGAKTKALKIVQQHFDIRRIVDIDGRQGRDLVASQPMNRFFQICEKVSVLSVSFVL
jgi:hypothetical protein